MKLPFDFGLAFFFRLILPGFLLALPIGVFAPPIARELGWRTEPEIVLLVLTILFGWLLALADMPIYMLLEGRRFWPARLRHLMLRRERQRLRFVKEQVQRHRTSDPRLYREYSVELRQFPFDEDGDYQVRFPTRLGNQLAAYEEYPDTRYGLDGVFFWPRVWLTLDKDLREELDNRQALVDSAVYSTFCFGAGAAVWLLEALLAPFADRADALPPAGVLLFLTLVYTVLGCITYRAALHASAQYGEIFKSTFDAKLGDATRTAVNVDAVLARLAEDTGVPSLATGSSREKARTVWRYLHNYRVRCPGCRENIPAPLVRAHTCGTASP